MEQVDFVEIDPSDSVSQVELCFAVSSSTSARRIKLRRKRVEAEALRDLELTKAEAKAAAAEAKARFRIKQTNLQGEEELLSERGLWFLVCLVPANLVWLKDFFLLRAFLIQVIP